jgi:hypothetical protein
MQPTHVRCARDRGIAHPEPTELLPRDHSMLARRQSSYRSIQIDGSFDRYAVISPTAGKLAPRL